MDSLRMLPPMVGGVSESWTPFRRPELRQHLPSHVSALLAREDTEPPQADDYLFELSEAESTKIRGVAVFRES